MQLHRLANPLRGVGTYAALATEHFVHSYDSEGNETVHKSGAFAILDDHGKKEAPTQAPVRSLVFVRPHAPHDVYEIFVTEGGKYVLGTSPLARMETPSSLKTYEDVFNDQHHDGRALTIQQVHGF